MNVLNKLEKLRRDFLRGDTESRSRMHWVRWDRVTKPIKSGGLGLDTLHNMNISLLSKWAWRYKTEPNRLWRSIIKSIHGNFLPSKKGLSGVWNNIIRKEATLRDKDINLNNLFKCKVESGAEVQFWTDCWATDTPFKTRFPALHALEKFKACSVLDRIQRSDQNTLNNMTWDWRRVPEDATELAELNDLINIVSLAPLSQSGETWSWVPDPKGTFSVKSVKKLLHRSSPPIGECCFTWNSWVPRKVNIFGWRMALDRLPTQVALAHRNISMSSICCPFCGDKDESMSSICCPFCGDKDESAYHLFAECAVSSIVWQMVSSWINTPPIYAFTIEDLLRVHENIAGSVIVKKLVQAIVLISCWS
ncbi:putative reverse transcriptase zinc-binding domain-containing protein [Helianthus annuus]|nr:putative reverse transcriptase zinc-binding domain-containing protein [Helianthus annuus]